MAKLGPFSPWENAWFHWEAHGTKEDPLVFICTKKIQNWSRNGWFMAILLLRGYSIEKHMWQKGVLWCPFVPKRSTIGQEMVDLGPFSPWEVAWFHWETHGTKGSPLVFICTKNIQNRSKNGWVRAIFPLIGCVIPLRSKCNKRWSFCVHLYQIDLKSVKK